MTKKMIGDSSAVAGAAADLTLAALESAIAESGQAVWVLAGGSSPLLAYKELVTRDLSAVDWSRVTILIGDERLVPLDDAASNWGTIVPELVAREPLASVRQLVPQTSLPVAEAARDYADQLRAVGAGTAVPRLDVVWLGVGEDGHTLSLFPGHQSPADSPELVGSVEDSPKPPPSRITLTPRALENVGLGIVFATGAGKRDALARAEQEGLPVAAVATVIESHGGTVEWLFDDAAWTA